MNRHDRKVAREATYYWARAYLGRHRLPNGVPAILDAFAAQVTDIRSVSPGAMHGLLRGYRRPYMGL